MGFGNTIRAIFIKDLVSELRSKQLLPIMIMLGVLMVWVFRIATEGSAADSSVTGGAVLLLAILFSAILASERSFGVEEQNDCISGLILAPVEAGDIYIGKLLVNFVMMSIFELAVVPVVLVLFNIKAAGRWAGLIVVLILINIGISSVGTLLGGIVRGTRAANRLLSILVMILLAPVMIPAIYAFSVLFGAGGGEAFGSGVLGMVGNLRSAAGHIAAFDAIFVTACWLLFGYVLGE